MAAQAGVARQPQAAIRVTQGLARKLR